MGVDGFVADQMMWSLAVIDPEGVRDKTTVAMDRELFAYHEESGMAAVAYSSQAGGLFQKLSGDSQRIGSAYPLGPNRARLAHQRRQRRHRPLHHPDCTRLSHGPAFCDRAHRRLSHGSATARQPDGRGRAPHAGAVCLPGRRCDERTLKISSMIAWARVRPDHPTVDLTGRHGRVSKMTSPYSMTSEMWLPLITATVLTILGLYSWQRSGVPGARPFAVVCLFSLLWLLGIAGESAATAVSTKIAWHRFQMIWYVPTATALACFALAYVRPGQWWTRPVLIGLSVPAALIVVLYLTNDLHHWVWRELVIGESIRPDYAAMGWIIGVYALALALVQVGAFGWLFVHSPQHRVPVLMMLLSVVLTRDAAVRPVRVARWRHLRLGGAGLSPGRRDLRHRSLWPAYLRSGACRISHGGSADADRHPRVRRTGPRREPEPCG